MCKKISYGDMVSNVSLDSFGFAAEGVRVWNIDKEKLINVEVQKKLVFKDFMECDL